MLLRHYHYLRRIGLPLANTRIGFEHHRQVIGVLQRLSRLVLLQPLFDPLILRFHCLLPIPLLLHLEALEATKMIIFKYLSSQSVNQVYSFVDSFAEILPSDREVVAKLHKVVDLHVFQGQLDAV